ncbi:hypothetical protein P3T18_002425 [Paraburkholderia sp. GAS199]|uniref:DUF3443 family protein n=1 Tax=Paraburkholderia sp. GAS199 TaxID=3035126 RepID=UPI003D1DF3DC
MRKIAWIFAVTLGLSLAACGGGGGGSDSTTSNNQSGGGNTVVQPATQSTPNVLAADATAVPTSSSASNTLPVTVSATGIANQPMVSVTICSPGTNGANNCSVIPNVLVDTGSYGLRVFKSALSTTTYNTLTQETVGLPATPLAECAVFGSGYGWGTVRLADVKLNAEIAQNVPVHVLADPELTTATPSDCQNGIALIDSTAMGANGILGIGSSPTDCPACAITPNTSFYYTNAGTVTTVPTTQQVTNPVALFPADNNGVILEMAQVSDSGAASATGTLVFGIDTQSNNALAGTSATLIKTTSGGVFTSVYKGVTQRNSFFDSGSTALFFPDLTIARESTHGYYVPTTTQGLSSTLTTISPATVNFGYNVANAGTLFTTASNMAFNNLGLYMSGVFDFGIPAFYGRHVYYGITGKTSTGGGTGPYVALVSS